METFALICYLLSVLALLLAALNTPSRFGLLPIGVLLFVLPTLVATANVVL